MSFPTFYGLSSDKSTEGTILPKKDITLEFGGSPFKSDQYPFKRLSFVRKDATYYGVTAVWMQPVGPELQDTDGSTTVTAFDGLQDHGAYVCAIGRPSHLTKMVLVYQPEQSDGVYLFKARLYNIPKSINGSVTFKIDGKASPDLYFEDGNISAIIRCSIRAGSKYLSYDPSAMGLNEWGDNEVKNPVWINDQNNPPLLPIDVYTLPACEYVEFCFYSYPRTGLDYKFIGITDISISVPDDDSNEFDINQTTEKHLRSNNGSNETDTVSMKFTQQRNFVNLIGSAVSAAQTNYSYMFVSQNILKLKCKKLTNYNYPYFAKWTYNISGWYFRIVSISFEPWNDEYTIILYRSPTL
jgi:hypothetical protein